MADIQKGQTFAPGDTVTDVKLNNLVDLATILPAFISAKVAVTVEPGEDYLLVFEGDSTLLKKVLVSNVPGVASVGLTSAIPGTTVTNTTPTGPAVAIAINQTAQSGNKVLAAPPGGASGLPTWRHIVPKDKVTGINFIPDFLIDWSISDVHYKAITAAAGNNFSFTGGTDGQTITVELSQGGNFTVAWPPGIRWENGTIPVLSPGAGRVDIFEFKFLGGATYGKRILTNAFAP